MARFVILEHDHPQLHWDLMLERGGHLRTWALEREPAQACDARQLADHRLDYLEYEGPVSGDRGQVTRWDEGVYRLESEADDALAILLDGLRLQARVLLTKKDAAGHFWSVSFSAEPTRG